MEDLCLKVHKRVEWFCNCLDETLWKYYSELQEWGMHPFLFHIFPLTMLFDGLVSRIFQLRAVLNAYPKHKVWVHVGRALHNPFDRQLCAFGGTHPTEVNGPA